MLEELKLTPEEQEAAAQRYEAYVATIAALREERRAMVAQLAATYDVSSDSWGQALQWPWAHTQNYLAGSAAIEVLQAALGKEMDALVKLYDGVMVQVRPAATQHMCRQRGNEAAGFVECFVIVIRLTLIDGVQVYVRFGFNLL